LPQSPIVRGGDDQRVLGQSESIQGVEQPADLRVEVFAAAGFENPARWTMSMGARFLDWRQSDTAFQTVRRMHSMLGTFVYELMIILSAGLLAGLVCRRLHISVLLGYLLVGAVGGQAILGWVRGDGHELEYIAETGVFMLLFSIGLEFSLDELSRLGRNLVIGGSVQMLAVALPVAGALLAFGVEWRPAVLLALAAAFSSTVLVFKALSEWGHASLPHGRRAIGVLLFQDAALVPLLLLVPLLTGTGQAPGVWDYVGLALISVLFVTAVLVLRHVLARWIIPQLASYRSPELVVLFTLVALGGVTLVAYSVGLPPAIGAFAAGLVFSGNRWSKQIDALILPFRETFAAVFFVSLGLLCDLGLFVREPAFMVGGLVALIALKAAAAAAALWMTGLPRRAAVGMGIGLAHVGEFAFVAANLGSEAGVIGQADYERFVTLAIGSLIATPLLLKTGLRWARLTTSNEAPHAETDHEYHAGEQAVVIGVGPIGRRVATRLETAGKDVCLVDLSPINLHPFAQQGFRTVAGDATDDEILKLAGAESAAVVVVCVPDDYAAIRIVGEVHERNPQCLLLVRCRYHINEAKLAQLGANRVVSEEGQASEALLRMLDDFDQSAAPPGREPESGAS
jgi:CPA2 family monovalent cation:H+ antiporter-2